MDLGSVTKPAEDPAVESGHCLLIIILETDPRAQAREAGGGTNKKEKMKKKYYGLQVYKLTFLKVDENGESIDGKEYEYTGDHSGFGDGIEDEYLKEIKS